MKRNLNRTSNLTAVGVIFYLADGTIQSCNAAAENILGYTVEQLIGASVFELPWQAIHQDGSVPPHTHPAIASIRTGQPGSDVVMGVYKSNGDLVWISLDTLPLVKVNSDELYGVEMSFVEVAEDMEAITKSKALNEERSPQTTTKAQLVDLIPGTIYVYDAIAHRNVYVNSQAYDSLGYTPQEISEFEHNFVGRMMHPDDFTRFPAHLLKLHDSEQNKIYKFEYRMRHQNGDWRWFCSQDRVYSRTADGSVQQIVGVARDITQRKQTATALRESEQRLKLATDASGIGMWFWDLVENTLEWTELGQAIFGLPRNTELTFEICFNVVHPEDRDLVQSAIDRALNNRTEYIVEYRVVRLDSSFRWILAKGRGFYNLSGEAVRMMGTVQDITAQKESEQQLQETKVALSKSQQLLRKVLDSLIIYVGILTPDGVLIDVNHTALEAANLKAEDVLNKPFAQTYWWSYDPKIQAQLNEAIQSAAAGEVVRYDTITRMAENKFIHNDFSIIPIFNSEGEVEYLIPNGMDISDRKQTEASLQQSEYELRLITEIIPQQIWTALPNGETDYFNQRWQEYTGFSLEQGRKRGWKNMIHPDDLPQVSQKWNQSIESGDNYNIEARLRRADGKYHWFLVKARPLRNEQGEIIKWYGTNTSITRIKELEQKLLQQTEDLIDANRLKDEFLAIVSHELRTPLNPILGWSQMLAAGRLDAEKTAMGIEIIGRNARSQAQLIEDLLDVSRILRGKLNLNKNPLDLESIIRSALTTTNLAAEAKSIQIETIYESNTLQVLGDAGRLQQVVWNLVSNAIKFTPEGGRVIVKLERVDSYAQIQVKDTGKGIDAEFLPYVFERFRQAQGDSTRQYGGLGLGLAIVRHLTELHGGTVAVSSLGEGQGATFSVKLPLTNTATEQRIDSNPINQSVRPSRFSGVKVLAVDDEPDSLDILTLVLSQEDAEVIPVTSAAEALEAFNRSTPDLIISDIGMPETDGYTLITQIRALPSGKDIPAIALTAYAGEIDKQHSINAGFQKHIAKPIDLQELIAAIEQLI